MSNQQHIPGDIVYIRFSGEPVGVLEYHGGANLYDVRRRIHSKRKGAFYVKESYYGFELEDETTHLQKQQAEMENLARTMRGAGVAVLDDRPKGPSAPPTGHFN
jgi:hypothetical protein